jgi:hypothetical protein
MQQSPFGVVYPDFRLVLSVLDATRLKEAGYAS